jgi:hypothetical protein
MATISPLLNLATPVQGSLPGTWGDTVNNGITAYIDIAIAGTLSFTGDSLVTLANTVGDASGDFIGSTTAQYMAIRITATTTATKIIVGPSYSKTYLVDNASSFAITFRATGQPGVSVAAAEKCFVYYNGTDYVKISGVGATVTSVNASGGSTGMSFTGGPITSSGTLTLAGTLDVDNGGTGVTTLTGIAKGNGASAFTVAVAGTDFAAPTPANNYILTGNSAGGFSNAPAPTNGYVLGYDGANYLWVVGTSAATAASLAGGVQYQIPFQSGVGATAFNTNLTFNSATNTFSTANITTTGTVTTGGAITAPQVGSVIPFYWANQAAFPSAATYHGALAHSHADGAMYFAHSSAWVRLLDADTDVTVAQGGTGLSTLTANNVILGNGTSAPLFVAPGALGNVLTSTGSTWTSSPTAQLGPSVAKTYFMAQF